MFKVFLSKSPFLKILIPFALGIWFVKNFNYANEWIVLFPLILFLIFAVFVWSYRQKPKYAIGFWSGVLTIAFLFSFGISYHTLRSPVVIDSNNPATLKIQIRSWIGETAKSHKYEVKLLEAAVDSFDNAKGKEGIIYIPKAKSDHRYRPGEKLFISGRFLPYSVPKVPYQFDYSNYLKNSRIVFRMTVFKIHEALVSENQYDVIIYLSRFKEYVNKQFIKHGLGKSELAILNAMFLGDKYQLTYEQKNAFIGAGAMHLLAVSGLHVGIIYLVLSLIFTRLVKNRIVVFVAVFMLLWLYALLTGFSASVLRATIMFSVIEVGKLSQRQINIANLLSVSMFLILLLDPLYLFSIGFWLSHFAVASIVMFYPALDRLLYFSFPPFRWLWSVFVLSLTAQLGALPISLMVFHQFPLFFIISNWLLIPVVTPVLMLALVATIFSPIASILNLLIPALNDLLEFMNNVVVNIDQLPSASVTNIPFTWWQMLLLFSFLITMSISMELKTAKSFKWVLILSILFVSGLHLKRIFTPREEFIAIRTDKGLVLNYFNPMTNEVYASSLLSVRDIDFLFSGIWAAYGVSEEFVFYQNCYRKDSLLTLKKINGKSILIVRDKVVLATNKKLDDINYIACIENDFMNTEDINFGSNVIMLGDNDEEVFVIQK